MSMVRHLVEEPPPLEPHVEARLLYLVEREVERRTGSGPHVESILEAVFRACVGVARAIKPGKMWDRL